MSLLTAFLGFLVLDAPVPAFRFSSLLGLGVAGGVFLWRMDRTTRDYLRDLESVETGREVSGRVRAEVESDVGFDRATSRANRPSPLVRRRVAHGARVGESTDAAEGPPADGP